MKTRCARRLGIRLSFTWLLVVAAPLVACSGTAQPGSTGDGGLPGRDAFVGRDARLLPDVWSPHGDSCDATDLVAQQACGPGAKCTVISGNLGDGTAKVGCITDGTVAVHGTCEVTLPTGPDACSVSSVCAAPLGRSQALCLEYCRGFFSNCGDGICAGQVRLSGSGGQDIYLCIPSDDCDPTHPTDMCKVGTACIWSPKVPDVTMCVSSGSGAEGASCATVLDCGVGLSCFGQEGSQACRVVCLLGSGQRCSASQTCVSVGSQTYGICMEQGT
ncbi:MAG: hypothetical protein J7M25_03595 [Deltaproteobacteria bacterium]|nr:hypothetical protein [Deltaproteobacteria bacterium]